MLSARETVEKFRLWCAILPVGCDGSLLCLVVCRAQTWWFVYLLVMCRVSFV
jgi:hypothetical protein